MEELPYIICQHCLSELSNQLSEVFVNSNCHQYLSPVFVASICNSCQIYQTNHLHCNLPSFVKSVQPDYLSKCVQIICQQEDRASKLKVKLL